MLLFLGGDLHNPGWFVLFFMSFATAFSVFTSRAFQTPLPSLKCPEIACWDVLSFAPRALKSETVADEPWWMTDQVHHLTHPSASSGEGQEWLLLRHHYCSTVGCIVTVISVDLCTFSGEKCLRSGCWRYPNFPSTAGPQQWSPAHVCWILCNWRWGCADYEAWRELPLHKTWHCSGKCCWIHWACEGLTVSIPLNIQWHHSLWHPWVQWSQVLRSGGSLTLVVLLRWLEHHGCWPVAVLCIVSQTEQVSCRQAFPFHKVKWGAVLRGLYGNIHLDPWRQTCCVWILLSGHHKVLRGCRRWSLHSTLVGWLECHTSWWLSARKKKAASIDLHKYSHTALYFQTKNHDWAYLI